MFVRKKISKDIIDVLKNGGIGVIPTDTIYGIMGSALSKRAVLRIYKLRKRRPRKPMIILIGSVKDLNLFHVVLNPEELRVVGRFWPGPTSIIFPCQDKKFFYLHRGEKTLAFRLPAKRYLRKILQKTGPLVAPSANTEGKPAALNIKEARECFQSRVDFYVDGGVRRGKPSALIKIEPGGIIKVLRQGAVFKTR